MRQHSSSSVDDMLDDLTCIADGTMGLSASSSPPPSSSPPAFKVMVGAGKEEGEAIQVMVMAPPRPFKGEGEEGRRDTGSARFALPSSPLSPPVQKVQGMTLLLNTGCMDDTADQSGGGTGRGRDDSGSGGGGAHHRRPPLPMVMISNKGENAYQPGLGVKAKTKWRILSAFTEKGDMWDRAITGSPVHASLLLSWRQLDLILAIYDLTDRSNRVKLIDIVVKRYLTRVLPFILIPASFVGVSVVLGVTLSNKLMGGQLVGTRNVLAELVGHLLAYPFSNSRPLGMLGALVLVVSTVQQMVAISLYIIMLTFLDLRYRELHRRIVTSEGDMMMSDIYQQHYDLCQRTAKIDHRFRYFSTAWLLGYTGYFLLSLNVIITTIVHENLIVLITKIGCAAQAAGMLVAYIFYTMRIGAWHDRLFQATFDRPDYELTGRTIRQGDNDERMHRLLAWRLKEFQPAMTIFNGSIAVSSRFFLKSGSGVMTVFYLVNQLQKAHNNTDTSSKCD